MTSVLSVAGAQEPACAAEKGNKVQGMPGKRRGIPASQLARDYGVSLNEFTDEVVASFDRLDGQQASGGAHLCRREVCAAVSAAMISALDASTLTAEERAKLDPLITGTLLPFWSKHCASDPEAVTYINSRSAHYLANRDPVSQVKTAVRIVTALLDSLEISGERREALSRTLTPAFAHRMVGDLYRVNDVRTRSGIELS